MTFLEVTKDITNDVRPSASSASASTGIIADGGSGGGPSVKYGLILHGTCTLPSVCMSTCTVTPQCTLSTKERLEMERAQSVVESSSGRLRGSDQATLTINRLFES